MCSTAGVFMRSVDRFDEESEHQVIATDRTNRTPLLGGKMPQTTRSTAEP